jgi:site-specific recombinase XerD
MIDQFYTNPRVLDRLHGGPLGSYIDSFAVWLSEQGYKKSTITYGLRLIGVLSCWMQQRGISVDDLNEKTTTDFLRERRNHYRINLADMSKLDLLLKYLRQCAVISVPTAVVDNSELGSIMRKFTDYLLKERSLSEATLYNYLPVARQFLEERFGAQTIMFEKIQQADILGFVLRCTNRLKRSRAKTVVTALRSFFGFLRLQGYISTDLVSVVPKVANWQCAALPNWIPIEDVEHLLSSCDQSTITGQRDYAILLLLARLGLRSGEVVNMTLDDIDWEAGEIRVSGKSRRYDRLPLPKDVGEALTRYLCHGRPRCSTRRVFVRMRAPVRGFMGRGAIYSVVQRAFDRVELHPSHQGPHTLRHSLATNMLRKGASLYEIGEILRHRDIDNTQIYAKVDLEALSKIAQPWPGGEQ